jgi:hypothetical protein
LTAPWIVLAACSVPPKSWSPLVATDSGPGEPAGVDTGVPGGPGGAGPRDDTGETGATDSAAEAPTGEPAPTETVAYEGTDEDFLNPERGIHDWVDLNNNRWPELSYEAGYTLAFAAVLLEDYKEGPIDEAFLDEMKEGLDLVAGSGIKVFLRFKYNNGSGDDASLEQILEHIAQVGPVVTEYADVITHLEAGFIGYWGEWHDSTHGLDDDVDAQQQILEALMDAIPEDMMVAVRTPMQKEAIYGEPLTEEEAYSGTYKSRVGHHDDCFMATETDAGTYHYDDVDLWKAYVEEDTRFTVRGGDHCSARPEEDRGDCTNTMAELESMHWTYLGVNDSLPHFENWKEEGCFDELKRRMGYRFRLIEADLPPAVRPGGHFAFRVALHNDGFASLFTPRPVQLVLAGEGGRYALTFEDVDPRRWEAGDDQELAATLQLPLDMAEGTYTLSLALPDKAASLADDPKYAVRFANVDVWDETAGSNLLGVIEVTDEAPGTVDEAAGAFEVISE